MSEGPIHTPDGRKWIYDIEHHDWIDVSMNARLHKLVKNSVRIK